MNEFERAMLDEETLAWWCAEVERCNLHPMLAICQCGGTKGDAVSILTVPCGFDRESVVALLKNVLELLANGPVQTIGPNEQPR